MIPLGHYLVVSAVMVHLVPHLSENKGFSLTVTPVLAPVQVGSYGWMASHDMNNDDVVAGPPATQIVDVLACGRFDLCVIGTHGLRIADSSIVPEITNGNLNGPSIMVGEKAADHILGRPPLPASNLEPWMHPDWRNAQR